MGAYALVRLFDSRAGLSIEHIEVGGTPITIFRRMTDGDGPLVIISHGFAGSQQLMQPMAITLAQNGYVAVSYDSLGHGRNPKPLTGNLQEVAGATASLVAQIERVATALRARIPLGSAKAPALIGHSMASDIVVRYAAQADDVRATIALSMFSPAVTPDRPKNMLVIVGALEPNVLRAEALRAVSQVAGPDSELDRTYGSMERGTARRATLSPGVEHIGVLYSGHSLNAALDWLNEVFGRRETRFVDERGSMLGLLFASLVILGYPLSRLLPARQSAPTQGQLKTVGFLVLAVVPAILTPLLLWQAPTHFLPILIGDYLTLHFALYGLITALAIRLYIPPAAVKARTDWARLALATLALTFFSVGVIGYCLDQFVISYAIITARIPTVLAVLAGTLIYFVADEWLARRCTSMRGAYVITKLYFLISLAIAVALNLNKLFFLIIIIPVILILFIVYGLFSRWAFKQTGTPLVGAMSNAFAFAYGIGVTFPLVAN